MFLDGLAHRAHGFIRSYPQVISYLASRNITGEDIDKYQLGYQRIISTTDDGTDDYKRFCRESYRGRKFENKVIFPIQDPVGRCVGIIGRSVEKKDYSDFITNEGNYTGFLYGLYQALPYIYKYGTVYAVEGTFDTIALASVCPNTVGLLTAKLYPNQYEILKFFCKTVVLVLDSDEAGRKGTEVSEERFKNVIGVNIGYKDPDRKSVV